MFKRVLLVLVTVMQLQATAHSQAVKTSYVSAFENTNHPQVAYWFISDNMLEEVNYKNKIDSFVQFSKYTLVFLTQRGEASFYDSKLMHPIFQKMVAYAHQKGLQLGLQIWGTSIQTKIENTERLMQEGELVLNEKGQANYGVKAKGARDMKNLLKSELFKIYAFKKTAEGFYDPSSLKEITPLAKHTESIDSVSVTINAGAALKGYTAYILTQHYYDNCSNFSTQAYETILNGFKAYADIPFDAIGLDEYKNLKISMQKFLEKGNDVFRERPYSLAMAQKMQATTGLNLNRVLFDMRYAPAGKPELRMNAINQYMGLIRTATLGIEAAMYDLGKKMYGKNTFIGLHNTFHNNLDRDEVWQTGVSWWSIKRDYGHTDENTPTAMQLGIGMSYTKPAMYNMFYEKSLERIWTKALYDLRFGIRTHYHAANDVQGWGVSIDNPVALVKINKVENAARLLNWFNPTFPKVKLLVIYGMEAMYNWYPNIANRGMYDINDKLGMEKKTVQLWNEGYFHAAVPTDLIADGRLKLNAAGKPVLNGYEFDAIVFLNPEYAKESTTQFIQSYVNQGGKLLLEGTATHSFTGKDISKTWMQIASKAVATSYSISNVAKLGVLKNTLVDGVCNEAGTYTFSNSNSLEKNEPASFTFNYLGNTYTGLYKGLAAIKIDSKGNIEKLAATAFTSLKKNGKEILSLSKEADLFLTQQNKVMSATIADKTQSIKLYHND